MKINQTVRNFMKFRPQLDPDFVPAVLWNRTYQSLAEDQSCPLTIGIGRKDGTVFLHKTRILPHHGQNQAMNIRYVERLVKFLLWQKGGCFIWLSVSELVEDIRKHYSRNGIRDFDFHFIGKRIFDSEMLVSFKSEQELSEVSSSVPLGRHLDGYRIGFDLGGSDRKCASLVNGDVVFSEEIKWSPYFEKDPSYHIEGIRDSLKKAAEHLPRVDAIGGSAAGVYVNNEIKAGSLYRGIDEKLFESKIRRLFFDLKKEWGDIPFEVANDGEVAALAGSMSMNDNAVLGISMGTSLASGYVTPEGNITSWLNELAFVPVDFRENAPADEWALDQGCGVQYFSQQAVARLAPAAGIDFDEKMPFPERLSAVQELMKKNDPRAAAIFSTIGVYFGYSLAHFADFYDYRNMLVMGRVTSGEGGEIIISKAEEVLKTEFPELSHIVLCTPDEKNKRHGQAIAAASLPALEKK